MLNRYDLIQDTSTTVSSSGDTAVVSPSTTTSKIRLFYLAYNADPANSGAVTAALKFGSGSLRYKMGLVAGAIFARAIGAGRKYIEGAEGEPLYLNLSDSKSVNVTVEYEEVERA